MKLEAYRKISTDLYRDLDAVFSKYNLKASKVNAGIDESLGTVSLKLVLADTALKDAAGAATTPEREYYKKAAYLYELKAEWLDEEVTFNGVAFLITGLSTRRSEKNVVVTRKRDGKVLVTTPEAVIRAFAAKKAA